MLPNRCVLQQQHVDCKIADALLKKGTKQHADGWDAPSKAWAHMCIHLPHAEGGFGVQFNEASASQQQVTPKKKWQFGICRIV